MKIAQLVFSPLLPARTAPLPLLTTHGGWLKIGVLVLPDQQAIGNAYQTFDEKGNLKDEAQQTSILQLGSKLATVTAKLNLPS
ncbi:hypothetical protein LC609_36435 [Nostoc sp. XA013]|nr:hypothetical protein [Nostoc sp. XA013]